MAFYLQNTSLSAGVTFSSASLGSNVGDYVEVSARAAVGNASGNFVLAGLQASFATLFIVATTGVRVRFNSVEHTFATGYVQPAVGADFTVRVERVAASTWEVFLNGTTLGSVTQANTLSLSQFLRLGTLTDQSFLGRLYSVTLKIGAVTRVYDSNLSSGTGSTLPTSDGVNQGTLVGFPTDGTQWGTTVVAPDYTQRKNSTFTATHTLGTVPDSVTINGLAATFSSATTTTVSVTLDAAITTSGEYNLVIADTVAVTSQTQTIQINVFGVVPINNPVQKDGVALSNLTNIQVRITNGSLLTGEQRFYSSTQTTDGSGNLSTYDVSSTIAAAEDPVLLQVLTAAGDSITSTEAVELI
jgi:hypothetical protein